jgi:hypothetical protein
LKVAEGDWRKLVPALADYDETVAAQAAPLLQKKGVSVRDDDVRGAAKKGGGTGGARVRCLCQGVA